jgi:hypothetical protein
MLGWILVGAVLVAYVVLWVAFIVKGLDDSPQDK